MKPRCDCICINLKTRKDRKTFMLRQAKKAKFSLKFFKTTKHPEGGAKGCLESHRSIIQEQYQKQSDYVLILEDDAQFTGTLDLPEFPKDWDIIYLGATCKNLQAYNDGYNRALECWSTHAYLIRNTLYQQVLDDLAFWPFEIDRYYVEVIQTDPKYNCYILKKHLTHQKAGYSDIENKNVNYTDAIEMVNNEPYTSVPYEISGDGSDYILKLNDIPDDDLPFVSIITPTYNRQHFVDFMVHNFQNIDYPADKLEWIIVDDSPTQTTGFPKQNNIKYVYLQTENGKRCSIGQKRNYAIKHAIGNYIIHMDDDDYYFPCSVKARVKSLITTGKQCIGVSKISCIDIIRKNGFIVGNDFSVLGEASMAYSKMFWSKRQFNEHVERGEAYLFLKGREKQVVKLPYFFVLIAMTHNSNITDKLRCIETTPETQSAYNALFGLFPDQVQNVIREIINVASS